MRFHASSAAAIWVMETQMWGSLTLTWFKSWPNQCVVKICAWWFGLYLEIQDCWRRKLKRILSQFMKHWPDAWGPVLLTTQTNHVELPLCISLFFLIKWRSCTRPVFPNVCKQLNKFLQRNQIRPQCRKQRCWALPGMEGGKAGALPAGSASIWCSHWPQGYFAKFLVSAEDNLKMPQIID